MTEAAECSQRGIRVKDKGRSAEGSVGSSMREQGTARYHISKNSGLMTRVFCILNTEDYSPSVVKTVSGEKTDYNYLRQ